LAVGVCGLQEKFLLGSMFTLVAVVSDVSAVPLVEHFA
jgi:hypothetical protein